MQLKIVHTFDILPAMSEKTPSRTLAVGERGVASLEELPDGRVLVTSEAGRVFKLGPANVAWAEPLPSSPILPESAVVGDGVDGLTVSPSPPVAAAPSGGLSEVMDHVREEEGQRQGEGLLSPPSEVAQSVVRNAVNVDDLGSTPSLGATDDRADASGSETVSKTVSSSSSLGGPAKGRGNWRKGRKG